jgi:hypothetical protein
LNFFEENGITLLPIPPYSPDLNPIENVWAHLKREISKRTGIFPNVRDVTRAATEAWAALPMELCQKLSNSMGNRIAVVIKNHGDMSQY